MEQHRHSRRSDYSMPERIAALEIICDSLPEMVQRIDDRLRAVERHIWAGLGIVAFLQVSLMVFLAR